MVVLHGNIQKWFYKINLKLDYIYSIKKFHNPYRSFDFEIELKSGTVHTFSSIEKEEYSKLFDFISSKKLHVKNTGKSVIIQRIFNFVCVWSS